MKVNHEMLVANAGSGKTYRLTVRTITLLALGVAPQKIAALTFTRKAAGEFLESVFIRLARAAIDPASLQNLQRDTGLEILDATQCKSILANITTHLHQLCMGTIDSLFARIARAFPLESGLADNFTMLGQASSKDAQRKVLATWFRENGVNETRFLGFLNLVRQQNRRQSEREVFRTLFEMTGQMHGKFLQTPSGHNWGNKSIIWPNGCAILQAGDQVAAADKLWEAITSTHPDLDVKATTYWEQNLADIRSHPPEQNWSKSLADFISKCLSNRKFDPEINQEYLPTQGARKARLYLNEQVLPALENLCFCLLKPKLEELLRRSESLHKMMEAFETIYARTVRKMGRVTFSDITDAIAAQVDTDSWKADVGYRLDSRFDHWLLDEFQDTSRPQWKVLKSFIDEVVQDPEGQRSFFYVGDTKQAIYSWRGGDPRLFLEVRKSYNGAEEIPILQTPPLNISFRSDPEIIEVVNKVFSNISSVSSELELPEKTANDWQEAWRNHEVTEQNRKNQGYVRWVTIEKKSNLDEDESARADDLEVLRVLEEVRPWEYGWTCAVLKRKNQPVEVLAALLQAHQIPVAIEGKSNPCTDNPLGMALLAAFRLCASPEDTLSRILLLSSSFGLTLLADNEIAFREKALQMISEKGFAEAVQTWMDGQDLGEEPFLKIRANDFLATAAQFDLERQSSDGIGEFISFVEGFSRQEPEGLGVVRLMTVHQAKGLTLDMTIIAGMDADPMAKDRSPGLLALSSNQLGQSWGLLMPNADFSKQDAVLSATRNAILSESSYGELCAAYVALTRPKHGLYIITQKLKEGTTNKSFARLLSATLGQQEPFWELGNSSWYELGIRKVPMAESTPEVARKLPIPLHTSQHPLSPSLQQGRTKLRSDAASVGREIHAALARIEWMDGVKETYLDGLTKPAQQSVKSFLRSEVARKLFQRPASATVLWRERAFDLMLEGKWVTGVFDRVHVEYDIHGRPQTAMIYDFKSDSTNNAEPALRHREQLSLYEKAVAILLGISSDAVKSQIIFIR